MSGEPVFFPDVEALIVSFLAARPELADIPVDVTLPEDFDGTSLAVVVSRVGGGFTQYQRLDSALVDLETYGPDKTAAHDLARTVRALVALMPTTHHDGAVVSDVAEDRGPRWQPDTKRSDASRYIATVRVTLHLPDARTQDPGTTGTTD